MSRRWVTLVLFRNNLLSLFDLLLEINKSNLTGDDDTHMSGFDFLQTLTQTILQIENKIFFL